ncbi:hypothetical protein O9993_05790 [Vibrio lentus]|nr:hypothetical protein [Vibrio lentus]
MVRLLSSVPIRQLKAPADEDYKRDYDSVTVLDTELSEMSGSCQLQVKEMSTELKQHERKNSRGVC